MIDEKIDVAVFCATDLEFQELDRALADSIEEMHKERVGSRLYEIQKIAGQGEETGLSIALFSPKDIGRVPAALATRDMLYHFSQKPKYMILCGIAAADPSSGYQLGDVVLPQFVVDYAEQKHSRGEMILRSRQFEIGKYLHSLAVEFAKSPWFDAVPEATIRFAKETNKHFRSPAVCHHEMGMACGDYVLDDEKLVEQILGRLSKDKKFPVTAVEMESSAIARAIDMHDESPVPEYLVVKSISDFAFGKTDSAQPYARATAAYFVKGLLMQLANSALCVTFTQRNSQKKEGRANTVLGPSENVEAMLRHFPSEQAAQWRQRAIDGAIEILRCPRSGSAYGGFTNKQIFCDVNDNIDEWPDRFGCLTEDQLSGLEMGLIGCEEIGVSGWLREIGGEPGRIRVLKHPPTPPLLDRPSLHLSFANSDYFTVRTITELSRIDRRSGRDILGRCFPDRWATPQEQFSNRCVPYHVSAQAIITCKTPDNCRYLLLASTSTTNPTITGGWGATMAEQMWAPQRITDGDPWWVDPAKPYMHLVRQSSETRKGDSHIGATLARGLDEEFGIDVERDLYHEPLLLSAAIEEDMYFVTFIYSVCVKSSLENIYKKWHMASDGGEMGLLAAYQLTGKTAAGEELCGPERLAALMACERFDAGPYLLPRAYGPGEISGPWHVSSRLRMYALGMHCWPNEISNLVELR